MKTVIKNNFDIDDICLCSVKFSDKNKELLSEIEAVFCEKNGISRFISNKIPKKTEALIISTIKKVGSKTFVK